MPAMFLQAFSTYSIVLKDFIARQISLGFQWQKTPTFE